MMREMKVKRQTKKVFHPLKARERVLVQRALFGDFVELDGLLTEPELDLARDVVLERGHHVGAEARAHSDQCVV